MIISKSLLVLFVLIAIGGYWTTFNGICSHRFDYCHDQVFRLYDPNVEPECGVYFAHSWDFSFQRYAVDFVESFYECEGIIENELD